jgi:DnaJ-class molecular chaperone
VGGFWTGMRGWTMVMPATLALEIIMANEKGPNIKKKQKCKNCEGKGLLKKGDRVLKCQRCKGTGVR